MTTSPAEIVSRIPANYLKAHASGDLFFYDSDVHTHREDAGIEFEIRLCPALQKKPKEPSVHFDPKVDGSGKKPDPFAPPYIPNLYVGELRDEEEGQEYVVLLNKFCVVPEHFLLVTKDHQSQTAPLLPPDLVQTYLLLEASRRAGKPVFAFYNCGDVSGASQHHKHLQFMPSDFNGPPIEQLAGEAKVESPGRPFSLSQLPYANHIRRLPPALSSMPPQEMEQTLSEAFFTLLDLVISTVRHDPSYPAGSPSYNVILTSEHMYLFPRKFEDYRLPETGEKISVNALGFAGMMLVKSDGELEAVKKVGILNILKAVGVTSVHDVQVEGTAAETEHLNQS
ncbi:ATP adenylyltransferase [Punctularia strigosozonata HHB-11173 SS5]|uniref:ATP adenylyltransferase n=1 Tax=Punctularia strigosozonata (strain HHB-11173) TaxID=741275 RepID=UPI0004416B08|nr:ATP adenylyltransferase [Punctularia strigosozonata HHB-11173 SS5]EIN11713.1 ATP adenylyltransferase [Punctularia strigosozonata HHB-11173 SS5]